MVYSRSCATSTTINVTAFITPKRDPVSSSLTSPNTHSPPPPAPGNEQHSSSFNMFPIIWDSGCCQHFAMMGNYDSTPSLCVGSPTPPSDSPTPAGLLQFTSVPRQHHLPQVTSLSHGTAPHPPPIQVLVAPGLLTHRLRMRGSHEPLLGFHVLEPLAAPGKTLHLPDRRPGAKGPSSGTARRKRRSRLCGGRWGSTWGSRGLTPRLQVLANLAH